MMVSFGVFFYYLFFLLLSYFTDSASHISTCATSDYAYMTSLDTIAMLCKECRKCHRNYNRDTLTPALSDLDIPTSLRRTHSNPENCKLGDANDDNEMAGKNRDQRMLRDARSCGELNMDDSLHSSQHSASLHNQFVVNGNNGPELNDKSGTSGDITTAGNPVTRVASKTVEGDKESLPVREMGRLDSKKKKQQPSKSIAISEENLVSRVSRWLSTVDGQVLDTDVF